MNPPGNEPVRGQPESTSRDTRSGVVHNAFALLRALGRMHLPVGVTRLAEETGIPKTTVHRLLEQLADENVAPLAGVAARIESDMPRLAS